MRNKRITGCVYKFGKWSSRIATGAAVLLGVLADVDSQLSPYGTWPTLILSTAKFLNDWSLPLYGLVVLALVFGWWSKHFGDPWVWLPKKEIKIAIDLMNNRPGKCLGFKPPFKVFADRIGKDCFFNHRVALMG